MKKSTTDSNIAIPHTTKDNAMTSFRPFRRFAASILLAAPGAAFACTDQPYIGTVCTFAANYCPQNYIVADGRTLPITNYQALFAVLSTMYGGDGRTTFGLPDLRGRVTIGSGQGAGLQPVAMAQQVGQQSVTLSAAQTPLVAHTHVATFAPVTGMTDVNIPATTGNFAVAASLPVGTGVGTNSSLSSGQQGYLAGASGTFNSDPIALKGPYTTSAPGSAGSLLVNVNATGNPSTAATKVQVSSVTGGTVTLASSAAAPAQAVSTQSPAIGMTVCIAVNGLYPSRY